MDITHCEGMSVNTYKGSKSKGKVIPAKAVEALRVARG
jgi:hypothetical protein